MNQMEWKIAQGKSLSRWAKEVTPENVHTEYPRPQMVRKDWENLNGLWEYAILPKDENAPKIFEGNILVPFPIESALSGVMKNVGEENILWYKRNFSLKENWDNKKILLHFGAVDFETNVWINGKIVGQHLGGYDAFTFDITPYLNEGEQEILVSVWDPTDKGTQARGKQVQKPHAIWYTPVTGIWQTVWLEAVPNTYIKSLKITPDIDNSLVNIIADCSGQDLNNLQLEIELLEDKSPFKVTSSLKENGIQIKLNNPKLWSPDSPYLYDIKVSLKSIEGNTVDSVSSYFGMRKISKGIDKDGITRILLNNEIIFQYGVLDQGWWPDGLYTAPCGDALFYDLKSIKELGFNMVRKHVKVEPAVWYSLCDKIGLLVWQDMPNGDKSAPWKGPSGIDGKEIDRTKESAEQFETELKSMMENLYNHPSIVMWVPFNEGWGQYNTVEIIEWTQKFDSTRLVDGPSGGNFFPIGDTHDHHQYPGPAMPTLHKDRAAVLGEFGGLGLVVKGHTWLEEENWGYVNYKDSKELTKAYVELIEKLIPYVSKGLCSAVYTQITDVETEINGLLTYDREFIKADVNEVSKINRLLISSNNEVTAKTKDLDQIIKIQN